MKVLQYIILSLSVSIFVSCNYTGKLTKRYWSINQKEDAGQIKSNIKVVPFISEKSPFSPSKPKTLFDLSEKGQQELIRQAGVNEADNEKLMKALSLPLSVKQNTTVSIIDYTKLTRRVQITVSNLSNWPADRIHKISVTLGIDKDFKISGCDKLTTEYQTIDVGKINFSNSIQGELSANASTGVTNVIGKTNSSESGTENSEESKTSNAKNINGGSSSRTKTGSNGLAGKFSASRSFSEEVQLRQRIVSLNYSINSLENSFTFSQQGASGIGVEGNVLAEIEFTDTSDVRVERTYSFSDLVTKAGSNDPDKISINEILLMFPNIDKDMKAKLTYEGEFRHVSKRHATISESDDVIDDYYGKVDEKDSLVLLSKEQMKPKMWNLVDKNTGMPVNIFSPLLNGTGELIFNSFDDANSFLAWLMVKGGSITAGKIGSVGHKIFYPDGVTPLNAALISRLRVGVSN